MADELTITDTAGTEWPATTSRDGEYPDYMALAGQAPFDKPRTDYSEIERRAELFLMVQEAGHPKNIEQSQSGLGDRFGVTQQMISKDMAVLREYIAAHDTERAKGVLDVLVEDTVGKYVEAADRAEEAGRLDEAAQQMREALTVQREFVEYLMESGEMDSAAEQIEIDADPSDAYMQMLKQMNE